MRAGQVLRQTTLDLIAAQRDVLDLTRNRREHGLAVEADVDSARGSCQPQSQLPLYEQTWDLKHALAVLTGQAPEALDADSAKPAACRPCRR